MIRVAQPADPMEAQHLLGVLEEHGIRAIVQGESLWAARGELPFGPESAPSLWVNDEADAQRARQLLAEHRRSPVQSRCPKCGADLREADDTRCPACAAPLRHVESWTCPNCHEEVETQFTNCWSCGLERGDVPVSSPRDPRPAADQPTSTCDQCGGTGRIERWILPAAFIACGLFLAFAALRNALDLSSGRDVPMNTFLTRALFAGGAVLCLYFARKVRRTACPCREA